MRRVRRGTAAGAALAALGCAACGARTALREEPAARDAAVVEAGDARVVRGLCEWPPTREMGQLTSGPGQKRLGSAVVTSDGVLVGWGFASGIDGDGAFHALHIGYAGSPGSATDRVVARGGDRTNVAMGTIALASRDGARIAATTWSAARGCEFVQLANDGSPTTMPAPLPGGPCADLRPGPDGRGYTLLTFPPGTLVAPSRLVLAAPSLMALDADGGAAPMRMPLGLALDVSAWSLRAMRPEGAFVIVGGRLDSTGTFSPLYAQGFDVAGAPADRARVLAEPSANARAPRVVPTDTGYLAAWLGPDPSQPARATVYTAALDPQGVPLSAGAHAVPGTEHRADPDRLALADAHGDALLAWLEPTRGAAVNLVIEALRPDGSVRESPPVALRDEVLTPDSPQLLATPNGALLFYARQVAPDRSDLFAFSFACLR